MDKIEVIVAYLSKAYAGHIAWVNAVHDMDISTDIRKYYHLPRFERQVVDGDDTASNYAAQLAILEAIR